MRHLAKLTGVIKSKWNPKITILVAEHAVAKTMERRLLMCLISSQENGLFFIQLCNCKYGSEYCEENK